LKKEACIDCGREFQSSEFWGLDRGTHIGEIARLCTACIVDWGVCARCRRATRLEDMRQVYCLDCRRAYDRDRWARQREARARAAAR
jgi:hypothetical protein